MPTDPPGSFLNTNKAFPFDGLVLQERAFACFSGMPREWHTEYRFSAKPAPGVDVVLRQPKSAVLGRVRLSPADYPRVLGLLAFLEKRTRAHTPYSTQYCTVSWSGKEAIYDMYDEYMNQQTILPLSRLYKAADAGARRGLRVVTLRILSDSDAAGVPENERALLQLEQVSSFVEVRKHFSVQVVRLQQDSHGVALAASLIPKQKGVLNQVEWHCPLTGGDGRQLLSALAPLAQRAEKNRWLARWKAARPSREVLARVWTHHAQLFLIEGDSERPLTG